MSISKSDDLVCDPDGCAAHMKALAYSIEALEAQLAERDKACVEWSEVSQRNYQRAKAAEQALAAIQENENDRP